MVSALLTWTVALVHGVGQLHGDRCGLLLGRGVEGSAPGVVLIGVLTGDLEDAHLGHFQLAKDSSGIGSDALSAQPGIFRRLRDHFNLQFLQARELVARWF